MYQKSRTMGSANITLTEMKGLEVSADASLRVPNLSTDLKGEEVIMLGVFFARYFFKSFFFPWWSGLHGKVKPSAVTLPLTPKLHPASHWGMGGISTLTFSVVLNLRLLL